MQELHDTMESFIVMKELTGRCIFALDVWRDAQGCMISYYVKGRKSFEYTLRVFYRYDTLGYIAQFNENEVGMIIESDYEHFGKMEYDTYSVGRRTIRIHISEKHLPIFLNQIMKEWVVFR
jgi:hypothetical protein